MVCHRIVRRAFAAVPLLVMALSLSACVTMSRLALERAERTPEAGFDVVGLRFSADDARAGQILSGAFRPEPATFRMLALSGGGANGAYGAGVLVGWSQRGDRPEFQVVTGVSTGALIAPFAFLGPSWDARLQAAFTNEMNRDLLSTRGVNALITPGVFQAGPLRGLVARYVSDEVLRAIAKEHARGRRLFVATTDLDTQETVIWDMGAIAARGGVEARRLFIDVLVASASIPGVFMPQILNIQDSDGESLEMHIDGGVTAGFVAIPETLWNFTAPRGPRRAAEIYVLINGNVARHPSKVAAQSLEILAHSYDTMTGAHYRAELALTRAFCDRNNIALSVSQAPSGLAGSVVDFDPKHMRFLFAEGVRAGAEGTAWTR
jgi:hypothetical protein